MRRGLGLAVLVVSLVSCGDDIEASTEVQQTTAPPVELVVETRRIADVELARLDDDDGHDVLSCDRYASSSWDYGAVSDTEAGREPADALADAIAHLNARETPAPAPTAGWVELVVDVDHRVFVVEDDEGGFLAAVRVGGDAGRGVWRQHEAFVCPNAGA